MHRQAHSAATLPTELLHKPVFHRPLGAIPIALGLAGLAVIGLPALTALEAPTLSTLANGQWTAQVDEAIKSHNLLQSIAVPLWTLGTWTLFHEGCAGLLADQQDVLYTTEELAHDIPIATGIATAIDRATRLQALLPPNVNLVVVPVPDKVRVLAPFPLDPDQRSRYTVLVEALRGAGLSTVDLQAAFSTAPATSLYLRTDTHWSPAGADLAAAAVAAAVPLRGDQPCARTSEGPTRIEGDLLHFLPLGPFADQGPAPDTIFTGVCPPSTGGLLDDSALPLILLGTSFSARADWGFADALHAHLSMDVLNLSEERVGPFIVADHILAAPPPELTDARLVIWELPERFLTLETSR